MHLLFQWEQTVSSKSTQPMWNIAKQYSLNAGKA